MNSGLNVAMQLFNHNLLVGKIGFSQKKEYHILEKLEILKKIYECSDLDKREEYHLKALNELETNEYVASFLSG